MATKAKFSYQNLVAGTDATVSLDGAPPDADITVTLITPPGGVREMVIHSDDQGHLEFTVTAAVAGDLSVIATMVAVETLASDQTWVSGSPLPEKEEKSK